jgi:PAS domain-containing protein
MKVSDSRHQRPNTAGSRAILDAVPAIAWCKLPDGSNEFVNRRWWDYTGIPEDEARGQGWQAAAQSAHRSRVKPWASTPHVRKSRKSESEGNISILGSGRPVVAFDLRILIQTLWYGIRNRNAY